MLLAVQTTTPEKENDVLMVVAAGKPLDEGARYFAAPLELNSRPYGIPEDPSNSEWHRILSESQKNLSV